MQDPAGSINFV